MTPVDEQLRVLLDGAVDSLPAGELERKLSQVARGRRPPLRVKLGFDPTAPDLHLGHTVQLRKLRAFQRFGHTAVLVIGGFTAQVGDPSGRSTTRPRLSPGQVEANAATYLRQAGKVLADEPLEVVDNASWLAGMTMPDVLTLASSVTVAQLLQRDDFSARYAAGRPIALSEFCYPLLQGRDSVAVRSDVELGGTDQTFNLLVGRDLQQRAGQDPQCVLTLPLLAGLDGARKMSKTWGNHVGVDDDPADMFGKVMSLPDASMVTWFRLVTEVPPEETDAIERALGDGSLHPMRAKRRLARELVTLYHSPEAARAAERRFDVVHRRRAVPEDTPRFDVGERDRWFLPTLLCDAGLAASGSEARRLVEQGGVRLDGRLLRDPTADLPADELAGRVLAVGRRRQVRLERA